jgi:hypothetical protein
MSVDPFKRQELPPENKQLQRPGDDLPQSWGKHLATTAAT